MTALLAQSSASGGWLPAASTFAPRVDRVIDGLLVACVGMIVLLTVLTVFILIRYRKGSVANRAPIRMATWKIETAWTVATTAVFLFFFFQGAAVYLDMRRIPEGTDEVTVVGRQWMWDVRYADGRREFNELHVRLNTPVRLLLSSEDVIHSFFIPAFRLKQDLVPGKVVDAWFNPTRVGTYALFCAQYCGTAHSQMTGKIVVLAPEQFAIWQQGGAANASLTRAEPGRVLFLKYGCAECHESAAGTRGPPLGGIYGSLVHLSDGRFIRADEQYLHDAILLAPKYVVAGYEMRMPGYDGVIPETDVLELISYIKSLRPGLPPLASAP